MANIEALEQLKRVVRAVPKHEFNMGVWQCGTIGCALGSAVRDDWFTSRGLHFTDEPRFGSYTAYDAAMHFFQITNDQADFVFSFVSYGEKLVFNEDVDFPEDCVMINAYAFITPEMVIDHIDQVIDHYTSQRDEHLKTWRNYLVQTVNALTMLDNVLINAPHRVRHE